MILEIPRVKIDTILDDELHMTTQELRKSVYVAWETQQRRFKDTKILANAHMSSKELESYVPLGIQEKKFIKDAVEKLHLSPRVIHRMMKLARTIADVE